MRKRYKAVIVLSIILILYIAIMTYEDSRICPEALSIKGNDINQTSIVQKIVNWEKNPENFNDVWQHIKPENNDILDKMFYKLKCQSISQPWYIFMVRCGSCAGISILYQRMAECVNIPSRFIQSNDVDHNWDESLIDGKWILVDVGKNVFNNTSYFKEAENINFSFVSAVYTNGTIEDVTSRYVNTSKLVVYVTDDMKPLDNVKVTVKTGLLDIINYTDSKGMYIFNLGVRNYTVIAEKGFLIGLKNERTIDLKTNDSSLLILRFNKTSRMTLLMSDIIDQLNAALVGSILIVLSMVYLTFIFLRNI